MLSDNLIDQMAAIFVKGQPSKRGCRADEVEEMKLECMAIDSKKLWCVGSYGIWSALTRTLYL